MGARTADPLHDGSCQCEGEAASEHGHNQLSRPRSSPARLQQLHRWSGLRCQRWDQQGKQLTLSFA